MPDVYEFAYSQPFGDPNVLDLHAKGPTASALARVHFAPGRLVWDTYGVEDGFLLMNIEATPTGRGAGTALLTWFLETCDHTGATVLLDVTPSGGLTIAKLVAWYRQHGFEPVRQGASEMRRVR